MKQPFQQREIYLLIGGLATAALIILSIIYYKERMLLLDNAFQTFLLIQEDNIAVMAGRWPSTFIRVLPYLLTRALMPLPVVMLFFSMSYTLWMALHFYLTGFVFKQWKMALTIPLIFLLPVAESFYWCVSELQQAIPLMISIFAAYRYFKPTKLNTGIIMLTSLILLFYHPLAIIGFTFLWIYYYGEKKELSLYWIWIAVIVIGYILKSVLLPNWYDAGKSSAFVSNILKYKWDIFSIPANDVFAKELFSRYLVFFSLFLLCIFRMVWLAKYWKVGLVFCFSIGYVLIIHFGDPSGNFAFYREANYLLVGLFVLIPLIDYMPNRIMVHLGLSFLLIWSLFNIGRHAEFSQKRIDWYTHKLSTQSENSEIISEDDVPMDILEMSWASPYESLLISHLNKENKSMLITRKPERFSQLDEGVFPGTFKNYSDLDSFYFK